MPATPRLVVFIKVKLKVKFKTIAIIPAIKGVMVSFVA